MQTILDQSDFDKLSPGAREEIAKLILARPAPGVDLDERYDGINMTAAVDLTPDQVHEFAMGASAQTMHGLRAFADHGPVISVVTLNAALEEIRAELLHDSAMRTRTVTGRLGIYLLGWNDWNLVESEDECLYAVTPTTYESLKQFFAD